MIQVTIATLALLLCAGLNQAATQSTPDGTKAVPAAEPTASPSKAPPPQSAEKPAPALPQRVHLIVDRRTEVGGTVIAQDEASITIERDGKRSVFQKDHILDVIPLVDVTEPAAGVIMRRDGSQLRCEIIADDFDAVRYRIGTVTSSLPRSEVYRVGLTRPFEVRYRENLESLHPDDTVRRLAFCDWLISEGKYELAREHLVKLVDDTKMPEAVKLLNRVNAHLEAVEATARARAGSSGANDPPADAAAPKRALPTRILTDDELNILRVYEIDFDAPPRVVIDASDVKALLEQYSEHPLVPREPTARAAIMQGDPMAVVRLAFELKARDFYPKIKVVSEPMALGDFRRKVHDSWLIPNCATSRCHGGPDAGRFFLFNANSSDARVRGTNLLTLLKGSHGGAPLVSFEDPSQSVLVQFALPADEASRPHPQVKGWRPVLGSKLHPQKLSETLQWIRSLYQPRPVYPIDYTPPDLTLPLPGTSADSDEPSR